MKTLVNTWQTAQVKRWTRILAATLSATIVWQGLGPGEPGIGLHAQVTEFMVIANSIAAGFLYSVATRVAFTTAFKQRFPHTVISATIAGGGALIILGNCLQPELPNIPGSCNAKMTFGLIAALAIGPGLGALAMDLFSKSKT